MKQVTWETKIDNVFDKHTLICLLATPVMAFMTLWFKRKEKWQPLPEYQIDKGIPLSDEEARVPQEKKQ